MHKKRLIGTVLVKDGWAVQSFGYRRYLPLGRPECLVENLDRWGADEILVLVIDRSIKKLGPDFELLERLAGLGVRTPLIYGGGIRTVVEGIQAISLGADRLIVDSLIYDDVKIVRYLSESLGAQAIIPAMPVSWSEAEGLLRFDYRTKRAHSFSDAAIDFLESKWFAEVLIIDWRHEGFKGAFEPAIIPNIPFHGPAMIAFGGISEVDQLNALFSIPQLSAIALGNFLNYREHGIQWLKEALGDSYLRSAEYQTKMFS